MSAIETTLTVQDVRESVAVARSHGEKFFEQIVWQVENEAWRVLGYDSWDAMRAGEYADMGVVAPRADRPELVSRMRAKGLTQAEIAGTLGVSVGTVNAAVKFNSENDEAPQTITNSRGQERPATYKRTETTKEEFTENVDGMTVDTRTGVIVDVPSTGLDGKEYKRPEPRPVPTGDDATKLNAIQTSKSIGRSLEALQYLNYENARNGIVTEWWPLGRHEVPPEQAAYFTPAELRKLAQGLNTTADLLEAHHVN